MISFRSVFMFCFQLYYFELVLAFCLLIFQLSVYACFLIIVVEHRLNMTLFIILMTLFLIEIRNVYMRIIKPLK